MRKWLIAVVVVLVLAVAYVVYGVNSAAEVNHRKSEIVDRSGRMLDVLDG